MGQAWLRHDGGLPTWQQSPRKHQDQGQWSLPPGPSGWSRSDRLNLLPLHTVLAWPWAFMRDPELNGPPRPEGGQESQGSQHLQSIHDFFKINCFLPKFMGCSPNPQRLRTWPYLGPSQMYMMRSLGWTLPLICLLSWYKRGKGGHRPADGGGDTRWCWRPWNWYVDKPRKAKGDPNHWQLGERSRADAPSRLSAGTAPCWNVGLAPSRLRNSDNQFLLFKPLALWSFVTAAPGNLIHWWSFVCTFSHLKKQNVFTPFFLF